MDVETFFGDDVAFRVRIVSSVVAFSVFTYADSLSKSKRFYYALGVAIGVVVGLYFFTRNRGRIESFGLVFHFIGAATFLVPWIDPRFKVAYVALAAFFGFCAAHVHLKEFDPETSPYADVARWCLYGVAGVFVAIGKLELNVAFGVAFFIARVFVWCSCARKRSDSEISEPTEEEIQKQREYYEEGRRNAVQHMKRILPPNELETFLHYVNHT